MSKKTTELGRAKRELELQIAAMLKVYEMNRGVMIKSVSIDHFATAPQEDGHYDRNIEFKIDQIKLY